MPLLPVARRAVRRGQPDGVILATPNRLHVDGGLECVAAGVPVIVEKPIGDTVEGATRLVEAGEAAGVPVLTGHHRNYTPIMATAREIVRSGALGTIVAVTGHGAVLQARRLLRRRRRVAAAARRRADPAQPDPRGEQPALPGRRHRAGAGGDVERDAGLPRRGHRGDGVHLRQRRTGHVPALRHRRVGPLVGADLGGEHQLRQVRRRGLLPHRRDVGVTLRAHHAAAASTPARGRGGSRSTSTTVALEHSDPLANQIATSPT